MAIGDAQAATEAACKPIRVVARKIKHAAAPAGRDLAALNAFLDLYGKAAPHGILISMHPRAERLGARIYNLPLGLIPNWALKRDTPTTNPRGYLGIGAR
jgi:hypothetical protein